MEDIHNEKIVILDFGSQYTQLIARRVRESRVYCEILPYNTPLEKINTSALKGFILSGGPSSVYREDAPTCDKKILTIGFPVLGICYGMQIMTKLLGGEVARTEKKEFGRATLCVEESSDLFQDTEPEKLEVWMSHGDRIESLPQGFCSIAHTDHSPLAAIRGGNGSLFGLQFHPEVVHTPQGKTILKNFLHNVCGCHDTWTMKSFAEFSIEDVKNRVKDGHVICGLSGGVDSSVAALLINRAIGDRLSCVFIDNGLLRKKEAENVLSTYRERFHLDVIHVDASERFLKKLEGVTDPEKKRKIIGQEFIAVFEEEADKAGHFDFLAQGTLYPDVIESVSVKGPSATIKTHHNVGGLPDEMKLTLVEPLRELFKDEVRELGQELGLSEDIIRRHPFPGPGLAIRIIGDITRERLAILREADAIYLEEIINADVYKDIWQAFAVFLPVKSVGVMGDERTYENVIALRAVTSLDGMTADWSKIPYELLGKISNRIMNEVRGVNRVVYDISSKPPSTIEWE